MAEPKTRPTTASVPKYLAAITPADRRADCEAISRMFESATGEKPVMWGDAIIGFGNEPIMYANGTSMDWPMLAFASRAQDIVLYGMRSADGFAERLKAIAPAKLKGGCVHIKRLSEVDQKALIGMIVAAAKGRMEKAKAAKSAAKSPAKKAAKTPAKKVAKAPAKKAAPKKAAKTSPAKKTR